MIWHLRTAACTWILSIGLAPLALGQASDTRSGPGPNIIYVMADDLGYGDLGCYGQERIKTPNLDRMAAEGIRFTQAYAGSTVCAPSRCVLMTGLHTGRARIRGNAGPALAPEDRTVAAILRDAGYRTALVGKWGLGEVGSTGHPNRQGFETFFGYLNQTHAHNYYPEYLWRDQAKVALRNVVPDAKPVGAGIATTRLDYSPDLFTQEALGFVRAHKDQPFFLYLALTIPHANNEAGKQGMEVPDLGEYAGLDWPDAQKAHAAMITRMDRYTGRLFGLLKDLGLDERTVVFFTSDNGPHKEGGNDPQFNHSSGPLRGIKRDLYEGGIRVPMIVRWPGHVPAGQVSDAPWSFADVLPTLADLADVPAPAKLDGVSVLPSLLGKAQPQLRERPLYWEFYEGGFIQAVRMGDWKAVRKAGKPLELYNLATDIGEANDIAASHPDQAQRLGAAMDAAHTEPAAGTRKAQTGKRSNRQGKAAATARPPNILFAIADDAGWRHMGAYGCPFVKTPAFDRVAREGILFNNCFTSNPKCSPSRASILTGRYTWQLEEACCHFGVFPSKFQVYTDVLEGTGYYVGFTGKGWAPGDWATGGFKRNPAGNAFQQAKNQPPAKGISGTDYAGNFKAFLDGRPKGAPFCFWYGGHEPHRTYEQGSGLGAGKHLEDAVVPPYWPDDPIVRGDLLDYAFEIEWFDTHLGRMLQMLEDIGELDNTLIVVTSDNGPPFPRLKGQIYEDDFHLPLAIRWGTVTQGGRKVDDFVNFSDFAPTFLEAAGLKPPAQMSGRSFLDVLGSDKSGQVDPKRDRTYTGKERHDLGRPGNVGYPVRAIRTRQYLYVHNFEPERWPAGDPETGYRNIDDSPTKTLLLQQKDQGQTTYYDMAMGKRPMEELYDLQKDPACLNNLAGKPEYAQVRADLWQDLRAKLQAQQDPRILGHGEIFDTYQYTGNASHSWDAVMGKEPNQPPRPAGKKNKTGN